MTTNRQRLVMLGVVALIVAVAVLVAYALSPTGRDAAPSAVVPGTPATSVSTPPHASPTLGDRTHDTGPGLTEVGTHVVARPTATGDLEVVEEVLLARPVSAIGLTPPAPPTSPGLEGVVPRVVDVRAENRGVPVAVSLTDPLATRQEVRFGLTTALSVYYRVEHASRLSQPSTQGRALVSIGAISTGDHPGLPVVIEVIGPGVRNVLCPQLVGDQQLCAAQVGETWTTTALTGPPVAVVAQVDLPPQG